MPCRDAVRDANVTSARPAAAGVALFKLRLSLIEEKKLDRCDRAEARLRIGARAK